MVLQYPWELETCQDTEFIMYSQARSSESPKITLMNLLFNLS